MSYSSSQTLFRCLYPNVFPSGIELFTDRSLIDEIRTPRDRENV